MTKPTTLRHLFFVLALSASTLVIAQLPRLSEASKISVLTCGTGNELYSSFGHTAFRVQDQSRGLDIVYNYGTFDFDQPNFYLNFARGRMLYSLSRSSFASFLINYEAEKRWVREQILDLTTAERQNLFRFFEWNYKPENREYRYDPLYDNCATKVGDVLQEQIEGPITFKGDHIPEKFTFRQLIMQHLDWNSWSAFGINIAYGAVVDKEATLEQHMFLPYYVMYQLRNATKNDKPVVLRERTVLDYGESYDNDFFMLSPLFWFLLLLAFVCTITYLDVKHGTRHKVLDFVLFVTTGMIGFFLILLWFATDHASTVNNFNILWALPLNLVAAFFLLKEKMPAWMPKYLWFALSLLLLTLFLWVFQIQILSPLFFILMMTVAIRYVYLLFGSALKQSL